MVGLIQFLLFVFSLIFSIKLDLNSFHLNFQTGTDTYPHDHGIIRALNSTYKPNDRVVGNPRHTIFVGCLHMKTTEETLKHKFRKYGKVVRCRVVRDIVTGQSKQYGFVEFDSRDSVHDAVKYMKSRIDDSEIIVDYEHERLMKGWKPRRLGGGFGGRKESGQLRFGGRVRPFQKPYGESRAMTSDDLKEVFRHQKTKIKRNDRD